MSDGFLTALEPIVNALFLLGAIYLYLWLMRQIAARHDEPLENNQSFGLPDLILAIGLTALFVANAATSSQSGKVVLRTNDLLIANALVSIGLFLFVAAFLWFSGRDLNSLAGFSSLGFRTNRNYRSSSDTRCLSLHFRRGPADAEIPWRVFEHAGDRRAFQQFANASATGLDHYPRCGDRAHGGGICLSFFSLRRDQTLPRTFCRPGDKFTPLRARCMRTCLPGTPLHPRESASPSPTNGAARSWSR